jgi:hypothetical protein
VKPLGDFGMGKQLRSRPRRSGGVALGQLCAQCPGNSASTTTQRASTVAGASPWRFMCYLTTGSTVATSPTCDPPIFAASPTRPCSQRE